jgi:hypothetical protein
MDGQPPARTAQQGSAQRGAKCLRDEQWPQARWQDTCATQQVGDQPARDLGDKGFEGRRHWALRDDGWLAS